MVAENIIRQTEDFAGYFFFKVLERLKEAGAPNIPYNLPIIEFIGRRTYEEEREYENLRDKLREAKRNLWKKGLGKKNEDEQKEEIKREMGFDCFKELEEYENRLPDNTSAAYDPESNRILLSEDSSSEKPCLDHLTHELLHALRTKTRGEIEEYAERDMFSMMCARPSKSKEGRRIMHIPKKVIEFFSQLNHIITQDVCKRDDRYLQFITQDATDLLSMDALRRGHEFYKNDLRGRLGELICKYETALKSAAKLPKESSEYEGNLKDFRRFFDEFINTSYLHIVSSLSLSSIEDGLYKGLVELSRTFASPEETRLELLEPLQLEIAQAYFNAALDSLCKPNLEYGGMPYLIAQTAINEAKEDLKANWASVFLQSPEYIMKRYIDPMTDEIRRMQNENAPNRGGVWQRIKNRFTNTILIDTNPIPTQNIQ